MLSYRFAFEAVGVVNGEEVVLDKAEFNVACDTHQPMVKFYEVERDAFFADVDREFGERTYERVCSHNEIAAEAVDIFLA